MVAATIGIDVAKAKLDVALLWADGREVTCQVANTESGHSRLSKWLQSQGAAGVAVCLEATGRYGDAVTLYLYQHDFPVSVVNPALVKHFAFALMRRNKTDKSDAQVLARYLAQMHPPSWQPTPLVQSHLQDLSRLRDDLLADRTRVKNRLEGLSPTSPAHPYLKRQLGHLEQELKRVEKEVEVLVEQDDTLSAQAKLLTSIVGVGRITALHLLAELPDLAQFQSPAQLVAYAGLNPRQFQSGAKPVYSRLSKQGSAHLRSTLYFPALSAKTHNPHLARFAQRLTDAGKAKMVVVAAVMRKLLVLVYAILKSERPYDPTFGFLT